MHLKDKKRKATNKILSGKRRSRSESRFKSFKDGLLIFIVVVISSFVGFMTVFAKSKYDDLKKDESFVIKDIKIISDGDMQKDDIFNILSNLKGKNILSINLDKVGADLENLIWIKNVILRKEIPDMLVAYINERKPVASVEVGSKSWYIDNDFIILDEYKNDNRFGYDIPHLENITNKDTVSSKSRLESEYINLMIDIYEKLDGYKFLDKYNISSIMLMDNRYLQVKFDDTDAKVLIPLYDYSKAISELFLANRILVKNARYDLKLLDIRFEDRVIAKFGSDI